MPGAERGRRWPAPAAWALGAGLGAGLFLLLYWVAVLSASISLIAGYLVAAFVTWWLTRDGWAAVNGPLLLLVLLLPFYFPAFELANVVVLAIVAIGLNILTGQAGQISLGHGALVAVGAYTTAILVKDY